MKSADTSSIWSLRTRGAGGVPWRRTLAGLALAGAAVLFALPPKRAVAADSLLGSMGVLLPHSGGIVVGQIREDGESYVVSRPGNTIVVPKREVYFASLGKGDDPVGVAVLLLEDGFEPIGKEILKRAARPETPWMSAAVKALRDYQFQKQQEDEDAKRDAEKAAGKLASGGGPAMPERPPSLPFGLQRWQWTDAAFVKTILDTPGLSRSAPLDPEKAGLPGLQGRPYFRSWTGKFRLPSSEFDLLAVQWTFEDRPDRTTRLVDVDFKVSYCDTVEAAPE